MKLGSFLFSFIVLLFSFSTFSKESSAVESPKEFIDSFIQTSFDSENWNNSALFFDKIKDYFDFHTIGRSFLGANFRYFNKDEFDSFVKVYSSYEVYNLLSHLKDLENDELNLTLVKQKESKKRYGSMFKLYYKYKKVSSQTLSNNSFVSGKIIVTVIKRKNQEHYKIINLSLDGVNWLILRKEYYKKLIKSVKRPSEIIKILRKRR